ncbi:hypothetical protein [Acaryochloris sp. CCMEE 5410]|uniref:hypothetical protein n=1 Tax=Acaryochloris sp. CCMEE 5410 TaxID=310037 RepID=UPI00024848B9|nr:hypothetical protein [Acaryochloris sp. CCMEE 5410]KAI9132259.1 hypothetical protein ON05_001910 [Acaryochloris sp. CCMEE 5410]
MDTTFFDTLFRDKNGEIVIAQPPNLTLSVWMGASLLQFVFTSEPIHQGLETIAFISLLTWALQELFEGVNYFRRLLGLIVFLFAIANQINAV